VEHVYIFNGHIGTHWHLVGNDAEVIFTECWFAPQYWRHYPAVVSWQTGQSLKLPFVKETF